jgi:UBA/TS-N domain
MNKHFSYFVNVIPFNIIPLFLNSAFYTGADPTTLSKDDKMAVLKALHSRLEKLQSTLTQHEERVAAASKDVVAGEPSNSDQENDNDAANAVVAPAAAVGATTTKVGARQTKRKSAGSDAPTKGKGNRPGRGRKGNESDEEMEDIAEAKAAVGAAAAADVATLVAMGFGERQAKDALEEADGSVEMAAEWLMTNCM